MEHVFWLVPGRLAGRPGPNRRPWDLRALRGMGVRAVLTLNDAEGCVLDEFPAADLRHALVSLPPNEPPLPGDEERCEAALPRAYAFVRGELAAGRAVLVHCSSGKDRTGLFMSYWLMRERGLDVDAAIAEVRIVRPQAMSAIGWEVLGRRVLARLAATR